MAARSFLSACYYEDGFDFQDEALCVDVLATIRATQSSWIVAAPAVDRALSVDLLRRVEAFAADPALAGLAAEIGNRTGARHDWGFTSWVHLGVARDTPEA